MSEQDIEKTAETTEKPAAPRAAKSKSAGKSTAAKSSASAPKSRSTATKSASAGKSANTTAKAKSSSSATKSKSGSSTKAKSDTVEPTVNVTIKSTSSTGSKSKSTAAKKAGETKATATKPTRTRTAKPKTETPESEQADSAVEQTSETVATVEPSVEVDAKAEEVKTKEAVEKVDNIENAEAPSASIVPEQATEQIETKENEAANVEAGDENLAVAATDNAEVIDESEYLSGKRPLLQVKNLKKYFLINNAFLAKNRKYLHAVEGVSFDLFAGKTIGIVGESGCGKTTMGRTILRLTDVTGGEVLFKGKDLAKLKGEQLRKLRPQFQMIFQDPYSSLSPRMPVGEIIGEAVKVHNIVPKTEYKDYIIDIMEKCGLQSHYFERYPHEFSGGQRQRICIAKVLALNPQLVICDEPVSALDVSIQAQIINLFKDLQTSHNLAYIFISHDLSVVEHISDDVGVMYLGNMVELAPKKDLYAHPMHPYTEALLSAVPMPDPSVKMNRITLNGDIPSPANPPKGCKFHTRCTKCMDVCKEVEPKFKDYGNGHCVACHLYSQD